MPDFTPEQLTFLERSKKARERAMDMSVEALTLGLPILAGEWLHLANGLKAAIANQERAFRNGTLAQQMDFNHRPEEPQS